MRKRNRNRKKIDSLLLEQTIDPLPLWKRALDVMGVLIATSVLSPLLLFLVIAIKVTSRGPVLYKQLRLGFKEKPFMMYKFRSMKIDADTLPHQKHLNNLVQNNLPLTKMDSFHDQRITRLGKMMRMTGFDELPQLINIIKGEMSLVGPRPCLPYEAELISPEQKMRFYALPGVTGLWQVNGKNSTTWNAMIDYDVQYIRNKKFWLDLKILIQTPLIPINNRSTTKQFYTKQAVGCNYDISTK